MELKKAEDSERKLKSYRNGNFEKIRRKSEQEYCGSVQRPGGGCGSVRPPDGGCGSVQPPDGGCGSVQPQDGGWGWMVVLASFLVHVLIDGIASSVGIFYYEFLEFYKSGKGETALVGSLVPGLTLLFGVVAGQLVDKFGCRITTVVGAIIAATGFVMSVFAPSLYFLYFSFGILSGLGYGLIFLPAVVSVGHYFERKRAFAVGLATMGSGVGGFIFNPLTKFLIDCYGWRGAILIQAGIALNCAVCGMIFRPYKSAEDVRRQSSAEEKHVNDLSRDIPLQEKNKHFEELQKENSVTKSSVYTYTQIKYDDIDICEAEVFIAGDTGEHLQKKEKFTKKEKHVKKKMCCFNISADVPSAQLCGITRLKNSIFILYVVSNILSSLGLIIPLIFLFDYAVEQNVSEDRAKWLGSIIGITNTFGRGICGLVADHPKVNKLVLYSVALVVIGTATTLCSLCSTFELLAVFSCVFGLFYGLYVPLLSVVLVDIIGLEMLNNSFGVLLLFKGIACLVGPPCAGWLFDVTGSYSLSFIIAGLVVGTSGLMLMLTPLLKRCREHKDHQPDICDTEKLDNIAI